MDGGGTQDILKEYEKYGINCMQIAKVLSTRTPAQVKKHAECFFKQNLKLNSAAVKRYRESLSPDKKAQVLVKHIAEQQKQRQSLSPENKTQMLCNDAAAHKKQQSLSLLMTKFEFYRMMLLHTKSNESLYLLN